jgi:NADH-ubiquinone oxidoreductase chain 6
MFNLFLLTDNVTNGYILSFLNILYLISILCAIFVIINKNPIISVLFLIFLFLNISVYLMVLGISFLAFSYILVYVGAISMLFLFILMLMNIRISELSTNSTNSIPLGIILFISFYIFIPINMYIKDPLSLNNNNITYTTSFT